MKQYYRDLAKARLLNIFDDQDAETALTWLISNHGRLPVVVVGAGFSLNAVNRRTGASVTRGEVPLWTDVLAQFATDLRLRQGGYDALTFAELYLEEMEPAKFSSTLLEMLRDDDLAPGDAHRALFAYPKEAIVTTNQLDTLLDKNDRDWLRIVQDPDLALCRTKDSSVDLIYFHGHRHDRTSWVFTRSQYEDLYRTRPLVVTKVRQLLSQHPVLIIGYSMSDPDFHHIYRQISLDMAYHHPLGLALFPHGMGPAMPERRHWEKLGIRIATFKGQTSPSQAFKSFFEINPNPVAPLENVMGIKRWIHSGLNFSDRCLRAADFLSAQERSKTVRTDHDSEHDVWLEPIRSEFTDAQWPQVNSIHIDDLSYDETTTSARKPISRGQNAQATFMGFKFLDRTRFGSQDELSRQIDAFLDKRPDLKIEVARWMLFALKENLTGHNESLFVDLLSWLWRNIVEDPTNSSMRSEAHGILRRCLSMSLKNGYRDEQTFIEKDAEAIGINVADVGPAGDRSPDFLQKMKDGFERMLDGSFRDAQQAYRQAGAISKQRGDVFEEWVALHGEEDAVLADINFDDMSSEESQALRDDYRRRRETTEQTRKVADWMKQARNRQDRVTEMVIEKFIRENRKRTVSGKSMSFSVYPHRCWKMFRDLETIHAPPNLQQHHVRVLVDLGMFDPDEELRFRLRLGVDKTESTENWLTRITNDDRVSLDEVKKRDDALLKEFTRGDTFKIERQRRLDVFPSIAGIFRLENVSWAPSFLERCKDDSKDDQWRSSHSYVRSLCAYAKLETGAAAISQLEAYATNGNSRRGDYEISRALRDGLPLEQWIGLHANAAEDLMRIALHLGRDVAKEGGLSSDEDLAWALFSIFRGANRFGRPIATLMKDEVRAWTSKLFQMNSATERSRHQGKLGAATHLAYLLAPDDGARENIVRVALTNATVHIGGQDFGTGFDLEGPMGTWISLVEAGVSPTSPALAEAAVDLWTKLDGNWDQTLSFAKNNPHHMWSCVAFLAQWIASEEVDPLKAAQNRLFQLVQAAPEHMSLCAEVLDSKYWGDLWQPFLALIWKFSRGGDGSDPVAAKLGAVDLLRRWAAPFKGDSGELPSDLGFLLELSQLALLDESAAVANRAAYAITGYAAHARSPYTTRLVSGALRRMAVDPRLGVRGGAAYAGKKLPLMDVAEETRAVGLEIDEALEKDPYAIIQRQRRFGELDGNHPPE